MKELKPLTMIVAGPIGVGLVIGIIFWLNGEASGAMIAVCMSACLAFLFFASIVWAERPVSSSAAAAELAERRYQRVSLQISNVALFGLGYIVASIVHGTTDFGLLVCGFVVFLMAVYKVIMRTRIDAISRKVKNSSSC